MNKYETRSTMVKHVSFFVFFYLLQEKHVWTWSNMCEHGQTCVNIWTCLNLLRINLLSQTKCVNMVKHVWTWSNMCEHGQACVNMVKHVWTWSNMCEHGQTYFHMDKNIVKDMFFHCWHFYNSVTYVKQCVTMCEHVRPWSHFRLGW